MYVCMYVCMCVCMYVWIHLFPNASAAHQFERCSRLGCGFSNSLYLVITSRLEAPMPSWQGCVHDRVFALVCMSQLNGSKLLCILFLRYVISVECQDSCTSGLWAQAFDRNDFPKTQCYIVSKITYIWHQTCHMSDVWCHILHVRCQMLDVRWKSNFQSVKLSKFQTVQVWIFQSSKHASSSWQTCK